MVEDFHKSFSLDEENCGEPPHPAIAFALPYLSLEDLLSVEMVCTSLRDEVRTNNLLWRNLTVVQPLSERIEDENLLNLAAKSQGCMESLTLFECFWISNDALKIVLQNNPKIVKLCVPNCFRITVDDMVDNLRTIKLGLKFLRVNGLKFSYEGGADARLEDLAPLLENDPKPELYNLEQRISSSRGRPIDLAFCKRCVREVEVYEISPKNGRRNTPPPPCTRSRSGGRACGYCTECENLGLIWYPYVCDDCNGGYPGRDSSEKIVSSACFVTTEKVSR